MARLSEERLVHRAAQLPGWVEGCSGWDLLRAVTVKNHKHFALKEASQSLGKLLNNDLLDRRRRGEYIDLQMR